MKKDPIRYISLAAKAGKLTSGADDCEQTIRRGKGSLLILAADAGANTEKRASQMVSNRPVRLIRTPYKKTELAAAIGRGSSVALALVTDRGLAEAFVTAAANGMEQEEQI